MSRRSAFWAGAVPVKIPSFIKKRLVAFDQFVNVLFGGLPDETISARWGRNRAIPGHCVARVGAEVLDRIQPGHVEKAIENDEQRAETVKAVEETAERAGL